MTVVADNCTDDTAGVARRLGCHVIESVDHNAGALNQALEGILSACEPDSSTLVMDANTV